MVYFSILFLVTQIINSTPATEIQPYFVTEFPSLNGTNVDYVIVTTDSLREAFELLSEWKKEKGINCVIRTVEWIDANYFGSDMSEKIRNFLRDAYEKWQTKWALLGGHTSEVPIRYSYSNNYYPGGYYIPTDMYYSCLNGNWNADNDDVWAEVVPDSVDYSIQLCTGRFLGNTPEEIEAQVNKSLTYETDPDTSYIEKLLLVAAESWGQVHCRKIANTFPEYFRIDSLFSPTKAEILDSLEKGYSYVYIALHGGEGQCLYGLDRALCRPDIDSLECPPFLIFEISCHVGWIDYDCMAWHWMLNPNGGSFAHISTSRMGWEKAEAQHNKHFFTALFEQDSSSLGGCFKYAKTKIVDKFSGSTIDNNYRDTFFSLILLGDPELRLWTRKPRFLNVSLSDSSLSVGERQLTVIVEDWEGGAVDSALVCVIGKNEVEVYARSFTDADGEIIFSLTPECEGWLKVTVTKRNFIPYQDSVQIIPDSAYVKYRNCTIDGNGIAEAGEEIKLSLELKNTGNAPAANVQAKLVPFSEDITVVDPIQDYGTISPGDTKIEDYIIRIDTNAVPHQAEFSVFCYYSPDSSEDTFNLEIHAPELLQYGHFMDKDSICGGDSINLSFKIKNSGNGNAKGVWAKLSSLSEKIVVLDSTKKVGAIDSFAINLYPNCFKIFVNNKWKQPNNNDNLYLEEPLLVLELVDTLYRQWTDTFSLNIPQPPESLWTFPGPHQITVAWKYVSDAMGYNIYRTPDSLLLNSSLITNTLFEDKQLDAYTLYSYWVTAVDSFWNESQFSKLVRGRTNPDFENGWPQYAYDQFILSHPVVGNLDQSDAGLEIVVGGTDDLNLYAWHCDGTGVLQDDGIFAENVGCFYTSPVIADVNNDDSLEIVCMPSWVDAIPLYAFKSNGQLLPGFPVYLEGAWWSAFCSPSVQDLDGDSLLEIFAPTANKVYAIRADSTPFLNNDNHLFALMDGYVGSGAPAIADIDGDDTLEVIFACYEKVYAWKANPNDTLARTLSGWPVDISGAPSSPAIGDVDPSKDGLEVVIHTSADSVYVFHADGSRYSPCWPQHCYTKEPFAYQSFPVLGDMDGDGDLEIALAGTNRFYLWNHDGTPVDGWPIILPLMNAISAVSPVIGDIDGDGECEVVATDLLNGNIYAFEMNGTMVPGFPIKANGAITATPVIADIDWDGKNELIVATGSMDVRVWEILGNTVEWSCFAHDRWHTGLYGFTIPGIMETQETALPTHLALSQNYPNPFKRYTNISYQLPTSGEKRITNCQLKIYDLAGRLIRTLVDKPQAPGIYQVVWDGCNDRGEKVASGVYFYRLKTGDLATTKKLILLK